VNQAPFGEGWMIKLKPRDAGELGKLLSNQDYEKLLEEQHA
jgi:glycine cleavage system H protein